MMTDKTNCSQLQVNFDKISNTLLVRFDRPSLLLAALQAEYTMGKALINIIASHTEIEILLKFDFQYSQVQSLDRQSCPSYLHCGVLQIDGLVIYGGLQRKNQRENKSGHFYLILCQNDLHLTFTERVPNLAERVAYQR